MTKDNEVQTIQHDHSIIPFEWAIKKVLGPTFDSLGKDLQEGYKKTKEKIFTGAEKKLRPDQKDGKANLRIAWDIITQATFTESEIGAEYFGGILAASKSLDGKDDTGIYYLQIAKSLSSKQLYLHYILYRSFNKLLLEDETTRALNVGMGTELSRKKVYFFTEELIELGVNIDTDFQGLAANNLINQDWSLIEETFKDPISEIEQKIYRAYFVPTTLGIQMMAIAQNRLSEYREFNTIDFGSFEDINLPEFYAFSIEKLVEKTR